MVRRCLLLVVAIASLPRHADAHPVLDIAKAPPPPPIQPVIAVTPPPAPAPWQSLGAVMGFVDYQLRGHDRIGFTYGLVWGRQLRGTLHLFAGYDFVLTTTGDVEPDGTREEIHGSGHRLTAGLRYAVLTTMLGRPDDVSGIRLRPHVDVELGGAGLLLREDVLGRATQLHGIAGVRLGLEVVRAATLGESDAPPRTRGAVDIHFRIDAIAADRQVGWQFAVGVEWAK